MDLVFRLERILAIKISRPVIEQFQESIRSGRNGDLRDFAAAVIRLVETFGVQAAFCEGKTGVWVENRKIASIGIGVRRWITMHGFALNVSSDLTGFLSITPCGLTGVRMTSLSLELDREVALEEVRDRAGEVLQAEFDHAVVSER